jgi:hypothetical protein
MGTNHIITEARYVLMGYNEAIITYSLAAAEPRPSRGAPELAAAARRAGVAVGTGGWRRRRPRLSGPWT